MKNRDLKLIIIVFAAIFVAGIYSRCNAQYYGGTSGKLNIADSSITNTLNVWSTDNNSGIQFYDFPEYYQEIIYLKEVPIHLNDTKKERRFDNKDEYGTIYLLDMYDKYKQSLIDSKIEVMAGVYVNYHQKKNALIISETPIWNIDIQ